MMTPIFPSPWYPHIPQQNAVMSTLPYSWPPHYQSQASMAGVGDINRIQTQVYTQLPPTAWAASSIRFQK